MSWSHTAGTQGAIDIEVNGVPLQLDDTSKLATSIYGKNEKPGDTPISVNAGGEFPAAFDSRILLQELLVEFRLMNLYLSSIVGEVFNETDIEAK